MKLIDKDALVAEIERLITPENGYSMEKLLDFIDTLEVIDPYELWVQYPSVKDAIQAHAEIYSFNIESDLFPQLTREQQELWRKEIEYACISGGDTGYLLAKDARYKENSEVKEVDLEKEIQDHIKECLDIKFPTTNLELIKKDVTYTAKKFFELGLKAQKGEEV